MKEPGDGVILSDELFGKFVSLVYQRTGISYENNKKYYVQKRIEKQLERLQVDSFNEYYLLLKFSESTSEFDRFINDLTINETYFFRDFPQLRNFAEDVLRAVVKEKEKKGDYKIKIWSAACSTGEEPYTLAIILQEMLDEPDKWDLHIVASDINSDVLHRAKIGQYDYRSVRDVPSVYLEKYFTLKNEKYSILHSLRRSINFRKINLMDSEAVSDITGCDFIFCRNVLIYFDDRSREKVLGDFYNCLNPGGFLFLGHSESVGRISSAYKSQRIGDSIVYSTHK
ncbi:CheR family methyltransferase [Ferviditalea candida]|uniref:protein-glutamate O-methyltransferase n=1 Tax=Ferviditalea candida TaxID=3108399 RepID=A0ABU5ZNG4_9BACL|nr:protein-glutamate O-methyltransferase CheR [Paenibacillaceae bacterium T2]